MGKGQPGQVAGIGPCGLALGYGGLRPMDVPVHQPVNAGKFLYGIGPIDEFGELNVMMGKPDDSFRITVLPVI